MCIQFILKLCYICTKVQFFMNIRPFGLVLGPSGPYRPLGPIIDPSASLSAPPLSAADDHWSNAWIGKMQCKSITIL